MKKTAVFIAILFTVSFLSHAQTNTSWSTTGNIGIGTTSPVSSFQVYGSNATLWGLTLGYGTTNAVIATDQVKPLLFQIMGSEYMRINSSGNVGIGTASPQSPLHISTNGVSVDGGNNFEYCGNCMIVQANTGSRSATTGAELEFVVPANTDGSNPWGQGRIITVAGNSSTSDATGMMILGTRRMFNKLGTGAQWYYGNDIVIGGSGNVGIGTTSPGIYKLAVEGGIHSQAVQVDMNGWSDYVFDPSYRLYPLADLKSYIDRNHHLPDMPSADEVTKNGINIGETDKTLTKKVEELTLYLITKDEQLNKQQCQIMQQQTKLDAQEKINNALQKEIDELKTLIKTSK